MTGREFFERAEDITAKLYGHAATAEQLVDDFALYGLMNRVMALENFDDEMGGELDGSPNALRRRAELLELRRRMGRVHEALRNAGR
jgi:hypothetical protein